MFMMSHIRARWERIRTSFWFLPAVMALLGMLLAELMLAVDQVIPDALLINSRLIISVGADEQQAILFGLAGTAVATAGVVFSLATVPLSVAASQFGSRLLRTFLSDPLIQLVMGCFTATVAYCLSVGLSIPSDPEINQLPYLATTTSLALFIISFSSVIFLIHHLGVMLQAPVITSRISRYLNRAIGAYSQLGRVVGSTDLEAEQLRARVAAEGQPASAGKAGYVDAVDGRRLVRLAQQQQVVILLRAMPGAFVMEGDVLAVIWPAERRTATVIAEIRQSFLLGVQRSLVQDVGFGVYQLIEIALRALSPAINDPLTAMNCLDRLGDSLRLLAAGASPPTLLRDADGAARVFFTPAGFVDLAEAGLSPIRQYGRNSAMVLQRLVDVIAAVAPHAHRPEDQVALTRHLQLVAESGEAGLHDESERQALRERLHAVAGLLGGMQAPLASGQAPRSRSDQIADSVPH